MALNDLKARYHRLRQAQRDALQASGFKPPNVTTMTVGVGWKEVFESGIHEFSDVHRKGLPSIHGTKAARFRSLARRADVWLPTVEELRAAWHRLHPPPKQTVVPVRPYNDLRRSAS